MHHATIRIKLFLLLLTGSTNVVFSQQQIFRNYTVNDGLISNSIRSIFQDSKGFLWIATWEGMSKYDGHSFTNYSTANGLSHNLVNDFYESKEGKLYVALNNGAIDVIADNKFIHTTRTSSAVVNHFIQNDHHPVIAVTDRHGLQEFRNGQLLEPKQGLPTRSYYDLLWLNDSFLVAAGDSSLDIYNKNYELLRGIRGSHTIILWSKIFQDSKKRIWIATSEGLKLLTYFTNNNPFITLSPLPAVFNIPELLHRKINDMFEDAEGTLWFATSGGLVLVKSDGAHQLITVKDGLASNIVTRIFQDKEKNIWIGTEVGLSKLTTKSGIRLYALENGVWSNDNLYLLYPFKKNHLLVSTFKSTQDFNKLTGTFKQLADSKNDFFYDADTRTDPAVLIGVSGMAIFDSTSLKKVKKIPTPLERAIRIISDKNGNFFFSDLNELYFTDGKKREKIFDYRISTLLIDKKGCLWVGTWMNGLFRLQYSYAGNEFRILATDHFLPEENIRSLYQDSKGNIWAGTRYQGVYRLAENGEDSFDILNFDQSKGLSSNFIKGVREDGNGNLWIAFYQGLDKLIPGNNGFRIFNFSRINNYYASIIGIETDEDHTIWLATGEGLAHISDGELEKLPPLPVYITKVSSADSVFLPGADKIRLTHHEDQLQFEFSSPGFINEKQILYSYRLQGGNNTAWSQSSNQHTVSYANLSPGDYLFEVRSLGWDGNWSESSRLAFTITPPFWQTIWFLLSCLLLATGLIFWLIRRRIKAIRNKSELKQKITEAEMMALRAQMNPHFIFNCLNSIDNLIQSNEKEKATLYLSKFAKLIRSTLETSKKNIVPCWKDIETLRLYLELEELRLDKKFIYTINAPDEILHGDYKVPPLVIQPFVENAIHHGLLNKTDTDKKLVIDIAVSQNHICYTITDNGVGRAKAESYKQLNKPSYESMGLQITTDRINLFNQNADGSVKITDLYDEQQQPAGTKVEVILANQS
jgi:ligand-binding sensor domain-containing protein